MTELAASLRMPASARRRVKDLLTALEWPMAILALLVVPALILEDRTTHAGLRSLCNAVNWFVWLAFVAEFLLGLSVATNRPKHVRSSWFELTIIFLSPPFLVPDALQTTRSLRALRALRVVRLMRAAAVATIGLRTTRRLLRHKGLHYVMLVALAMVVLGAAGIYVVERGETIKTFADALWWSVVTVTTVGYGDVSPVTAEGRFIALALMIIGIGVVSVLTATIASFFVEQGNEKEVGVIESRLASVEGRLDEILAELRRR